MQFVGLSWLLYTSDGPAYYYYYTIHVLEAANMKIWLSHLPGEFFLTKVMSEV